MNSARVKKKLFELVNVLKINYILINFFDLQKFVAFKVHLKDFQCDFYQFP